MSFAQYYFPDVPGLGNVAVSRHAQDKAERDGITEARFIEVLMHGKDRPDGMTTVWREHESVRLVILLRPEPFQGACLVTRDDGSPSASSRTTGAPHIMQHERHEWLTA